MGHTYMYTHRNNNIISATHYSIKYYAETNSTNSKFSNKNCKQESWTKSKKKKEISRRTQKWNHTVLGVQRGIIYTLTDGNSTKLIVLILYTQYHINSHYTCRFAANALVSLLFEVRHKRAVKVRILSGVSIKLVRASNFPN